MLLSYPRQSKPLLHRQKQAENLTAKMDETDRMAIHHRKALIISMVILVKMVLMVKTEFPLHILGVGLLYPLLLLLAHLPQTSRVRKVTRVIKAILVCPLKSEPNLPTKVTKSSLLMKLASIFSSYIMARALSIPTISA